MKTIIVPTDFSKNAAHAEVYAIHLAHKLGHKVLLVHAFETPVVISEYDISTLHLQAIEERVAQQLEKKRQDLQQQFGTAVPISALVIDGDLIEYLKDQYLTEDIFLTVIGLTGKGMASFFLGSTTLNIVNNLGRAVLTIPPFTPFRPIKKIVFAFDLCKVSETFPVKRVKRIQADLDASLSILSLRPDNQNADEEQREEREQLELLMAGTPFIFHTFSGKKVVDDIRTFAKEQQADLLAIVPREKGFIKSLLGENHTKALLFRSGIPILSLPPDEES